ncbi:MAG: tetraacyldisaccharide 4'-kinase [Alphaproteobacteria bacterium]|nr:tetraacyldisaccharide 4'-kinase [Alphaproteobacteria bacterium]
MSEAAYRLAWWLLTPPAALLTALHPRTRGAWAERWGLSLPAVEPGAILVHASSVGEGRAAEALLSALNRQAPPGQVFLRTAWTDTGLAQARGHDALCAAPVDAPWLLARWLDRVRPRALVLVEAELWPGMLSACRARGIPVFVAGARAGAGLERLARLAPGLLAEIGEAVQLWLARDEEAAAALTALGLGPVEVVGEPKLDAPVRRLPLIFPMSIWVGASTRPGDEAALLAALPQGKQLLLAPRHPQRFEAVAALLDASGRPWARRSALPEGLVPEALDVVLLDSLGELAGAFAQASAAFVGGSFDVDIGGHSPAEALAAGAPVVRGPHDQGHAALFTPTRSLRCPAPEALGEAMRAAEALGRVKAQRSGAAERVAARVLAALGDIPPERPHRPALAPLVALASSLRPEPSGDPPPNPIPVISVGNLSSGGAGKTQVVRWLLRALEAHAPAVVSRGYRRQAEGPALRCSAERADAAWLGDELAMLAAEGWLAVSAPDRRAGVAFAAEAGAGIAVLDDAFQRRDVSRDLDVVVVDALHPRSGGLLPVGEGREPLSALARADLIWVMGPYTPPELLEAAAPGARFVRAQARPRRWRLHGEWRPLRELGGPFHAFAGIAHPGRFLVSLKQAGAEVWRWQAFPDHHAWSAAELAALRAPNIQLITTAKDHARLGAPEDIAVLELELVIEEGEAALRALLRELTR